jgi:tyrosine-protein kinase Etk/Wzc
MNEIFEKPGANFGTTQTPETGLIGLLIVFAKRKRLIVGLPVLATLVAVVASLAMPNVFRAATKIMPPQQSQSGASALLAQLGGMAGAAAAAAGIKSPNDLYIGMLKSRTVADHLIERFKLQQAYGVDSVEKTRRELEKNTTIGAGKDGMIVVEVEDEDKKKAPLLANAYVEELSKLTNVLAVTEAAQRRLFFEKQLEQAKNNLAVAEAKLKTGLDSKGVISVDSESRAIVETIARLRARISAKEVELSSIGAFVTTNNPAYQRIQQELNSLHSELTRLQSGSAGDPVSKDGTEKLVGLESVQLLRDVKYYQMLYELLAKQYEVARLDEAKDAAMIQVVDPAVEPERKAKPARALIVLGTTFVSFLLSVILAFALETKERAMQRPEVRNQWNELKRQLRSK